MHQHRYPRIAHRLAVGALCALAVAGCTSDGKGSGGSSASGSSSPTSSESPAPGAPAADDAAAATAPPTDYSSDPVVVRGAPAGQLVAVTGQTVDGVDQLTFQFDGVAPGYRVEAVPRVTTGPDGDVVELAGKSFLQMAFASTTPNAGGAIAEGVPTNTDLDLPVLKQIVLAYNVAGDVRFGVGVDATDPTFRVVPLADPTRLVLEVRPG
jgi:hypothetical protein